MVVGIAWRELPIEAPFVRLQAQSNNVHTTLHCNSSMCSLGLILEVVCVDFAKAAAFCQYYVYRFPHSASCWDP